MALRLRIKKWWLEWRGFFLGLAMGPIVYGILLIIADIKKIPHYNCPVCGENQKLYWKQEQCPCCKNNMRWGSWF